MSQSVGYLFKCRCGVGFDDILMAKEHLVDHKIEFTKGDINLKLCGKFKCGCGNEFLSVRCSIIQQRDIVITFPMKCQNCMVNCYPKYWYYDKLINDDQIQNVCNWNFTMKKLKGLGKPYKHHIDHLRALCQACRLGVCENFNLMTSNMQNQVKRERIDRRKVIQKKSDPIDYQFNYYSILEIDDNDINDTNEIL